MRNVDESILWITKLNGSVIFRLEKGPGGGRISVRVSIPTGKDGMLWTDSMLIPISQMVYATSSLLAEVLDRMVYQFERAMEEKSCQSNSPTPGTP